MADFDVLTLEHTRHSLSPSILVGFLVIMCSNRVVQSIEMLAS